MVSSFDLNKLQDLLKDFYQLTRIRITVFDDSFHELASYPAEIPAFCQMIRSTSSGALECRKCDEDACALCSKRRALYTYRCHAGLTESVSPIIVGNLIIGYLLFGHVFDYDNHEIGWKEIQTYVHSQPLDMDALKTSCYQLPIISKDYIASASHIMQAVGSYLCMERMVSLRQQELPVQIDNYILAHYTEEIDAVSIAAHFQIGKTKIYQLAKESYGMGIAEYIRNLRIKKARLLLTEQPELTLSEIASLCGFSDYNYFITVFKRVVGMPPKAYASSLPESY